MYEFVDCAENAPVENQEMHVAHTTTGAQRAITLRVGRGRDSDELFDGAVDNRQDLLTELRVEEVLELRPLTDVAALCLRRRRLLLREVTSRHQIEELQHSTAILLGPIALELLIER